LMDVTGQTFDMDPKTFTLGSMFAMQLHKFSDEIGKITNAAVKELTIESELKKLADAWRDQRFEVFKYMKVSTGDTLSWDVMYVCCAITANSGVAVAAAASVYAVATRPLCPTQRMPSISQGRLCTRRVYHD
jgi:hypothetical protein